MKDSHTVVCFVPLDKWHLEEGVKSVSGRKRVRKTRRDLTEEMVLFQVLKMDRFVCVC